MNKDTKLLIDMLYETEVLTGNQRATILTRFNYEDQRESERLEKIDNEVFGMEGL